MAVAVGLSFNPINGRAKNRKKICTRKGVLRTISTNPITRARNQAAFASRAATPATPITIASVMPASARPNVPTHPHSSAGIACQTTEKSSV
ncbi:hypothetical protein ABIF64_004935 [Bradyrhizobium japonicum]